MNVVAWSRSLTPQAAEAQGVGYAASPLELAAVADAVSIHLAFTPETKHLVGSQFLDALRPGAILVNTSRGSLVDTAALRAAIAAKGLRVGLDVFEGEPAAAEAEWTDKELASSADLHARMSALPPIRPPRPSPPKSFASLTCSSRPATRRAPSTSVPTRRPTSASSCGT